MPPRGKKKFYCARPHVKIQYTIGLHGKHGKCG
jgi:hypothetical protein